MFDDKVNSVPPCICSRKVEMNNKWIREAVIEKLNVHFERFIATASIEQLEELEMVYKMFAALREARMN
jgi:hypothetical protein